MRLAAAWTMLMSISLAVLVTAACAVAFGGGFFAWLLAVPAMFVALHLFGLPAVLLCELGEKLKLLRRSWRPLVDEMLAVSLLVFVAGLVLPRPVAAVVAGFFVLMYLLRLCLHRCWIPGEPEEVQA